MSNQMQDAFSKVLSLQGRSFNDAVVVSGIDARQLRNGLDRGSLTVGEKLRIGRWSFTGRDLLELMIADRLSKGTWMPIGQAAQAAKMIAPHAERLFEIALSIRKEDEAAHQIIEIIICREQDDLEVTFQLRGADSGVFDTNWKRLDRGRQEGPHIRLPVVDMLSDFLQSTKLAFEDETK